jgi:large-conductance mechanosensitive channel
MAAIKSVFKSFVDWLVGYGVVGTASGTLIASAVTDLSKSFSDTIILPSIKAWLIPNQPLILNPINIVVSISNFLTMILIAWTFAIVVGIHRARPVTLVKVIQ